MQAISRLTCGCIPSQYQDSNNVSSGVVSASKLKSNMVKRFNQLEETGQQPHICYQIAVHAGRAGNAISQQAEERLAPELNYSQGYKDLMGITPTSGRSDFDSRQIPESGILNFQSRETGRMVHTAYLHKEGNSLHLVHANGLALDVEFPKNPELQGGAGFHDISTGSDMNLQRYLNKNGLQFHYTKASDLNTNAAR